MHVSVVTPDVSLFDGDADSVNLQAMDGRFGILANHAPLIARLGHGVAEVADGKTVHRFAVYGGFVKVQDNVVSVLAGGADEAHGDLSAAQAAVDSAEKALGAAKDGGDAVDVADAEEQLRRAKAFRDLF
jgi:F-type H+-transporting ATPase subunit epsilon